MKRLFFLLMITVVTTPVWAQQGLSKISIQQSTHLPISSLKAFAEKPSFRGFSASYQYFINNQLSVGLTGGYSDFYQKKDRQTYTIGETEVSAVKSHSLQVVPFMLTAGYSKVKEGSLFQPYVNLGAGASFVNYEEWYGTLVDNEGGVKLSVSPAIGARIAFNKYSLAGMDLSVRYNFTSFKYSNIKNLQTVSLNLGIFFFAKN
ncbi:outer membrane protein W [Lacibacter cauensis]|uniref:Outer membrane protein W n=1 Tax=Lacibacter cauensis TaxID=510947 RepID=A0A562SE51_9BACT|nr:OmpW family outer membrane protein [Lacibacter cauensis]TWI79383.1 outer membrane protein W [Lacibacter cauensis]